MKVKKFEYTDKKKKGFYRFIAFFVCLFNRPVEFLGMENMPEEPCVIVCNHAKARGPIMAEAYLPFKKRIWCDAPMFDKKEFVKYAYSAFWGGKVNCFKRFFVKLLAPLVAYVFKNADAIPVYRDMRVVKTYKASVEELNEGKSVLIFPECPDEYNEIINKLNVYFVDVARYYYKQTGKELLFVPMYYGATIRKAIIGNAVKFDSNADIADERKRVTDALLDETTRVAKMLPVHKVIPFNNVKKKYYKNSK